MYFLSGTVQLAAWSVRTHTAASYCIGAPSILLVREIPVWHEHLLLLVILYGGLIDAGDFNV